MTGVKALPCRQHDTEPTALLSVQRSAGPWIFRPPCAHSTDEASWSSENEHTCLKLHSPGGSAGKESACNAGDPGSIPGLGRSAGEGNGYPLQFYRASLVAQLVKNPPAMWETWVQSLGWEDPLEKGKASDSSILAWRILLTV